MKIGHNLMAANAIRNTNANATTASKSMEKLSSGLAITNAADNAAGLAVSEKMKGQIRGLDQASKNAQDGVSLIQTADGALSETTSILQRMRELANQATNDSNTSADRDAIQTETNELVSQLDNIANTTQFNTKNLLNGGAGIAGTATNGLQIFGGTSAVQIGTVSVTGIAAAKASTTTISSGANNQELKTGTGASVLQINGTTVNLAAGSTGAQIATAINAVTGTTGVTAAYSTATAGTEGSLVLTSSGVGAAASVKISGITETSGGAATDTFVNATLATTQVKMTNTSGATLLTANAIAGATQSNITGSDATAAIAGSTTTASGNIVTFHGGTVDGLKVNAAASSAATSTLNITANNTLSLQIGANQGQTMSIAINSMTAASLNVNALSLTTQSGAANAVSLIDTATATVSSERAKLGAYQNRLESTINNLGTTAENLTSAQSSVSDVDMAKEMAEYSKNNILSQASQAMLAQANQQPQQVLKLLQ